MRYNYFLVFGLLVCCLLTTACWDRHELQERNFVMAVGFDLPNEGLKDGQTVEGTKIETFNQLHGEKRYRMSMQILRIPAGKEAATKGRTYVISNTGQSIFELIRDMLGQSSKSLWFEHLQAIVISEDLVKQVGLSEIWDFFLRDSEMRWRIRVFITPGEARKILEYVPPSKEASGVYINNLVKLHTRNYHIPGMQTDLGYTEKNLDNNANAYLPVVTITDGILKSGGMAMFKGDKFVGYIDEYAVAGAKIIFASEKLAVIVVNCPEHPDRVIAFKIFNHDTKLSTHESDGKAYFTLNIDMRGNIGEIQCPVEHKLDNEFLQKLEVAIADEVKRTIKYSLHEQQRLNVDADDLALKIKADKPELWEKIKDQWDVIFPTIEIIPSVNVHILNIGNHE